MKTLYVASEVRAFVKTGGLADVSQELPKSLVKKKIDCRVVLPLYAAIPEDLRNKRKFIKDITVRLGWRVQRWEIFEVVYEGVTYYLLGNQRYFDRSFNMKELYGDFDDAERFAYFSMAVLSMLQQVDFKPEIIIASDWQTAMIPVYYQYYFAQNEWYSGIKTAVTIHNIAFQGDYGMDVFDNVLGLPGVARGLMEYNGRVNFLKAGMQAAHRIITVSPGYAEEISGKQANPYWYDFGKKLTPFIQQEYGKLKGILNGEDSSPETDKYLIDLGLQYNLSSYKEGKRRNKQKLQEFFGLEQRSDIPLMSIVTRIDSLQKGCDLLIDVLNNRVDDGNFQFVLLGTPAPGDIDGERMVEQLKKCERAGRIAIHIDYNEGIAKMVYAGGDMFFAPSLFEPCGLSQLVAMRYGNIPIVRETGGLASTVKDNGNGDGTGYTFKDYTVVDFSNAIDRALEAYKNQHEWDALVKRAMSCDYRWEARSANDYIAFFKEMIG